MFSCLCVYKSHFDLSHDCKATNSEKWQTSFPTCVLSSTSSTVERSFENQTQHRFIKRRAPLIGDKVVRAAHQANQFHSILKFCVISLPPHTGPGTLYRRSTRDGNSSTACSIDFRSVFLPLTSEAFSEGRKRECMISNQL